MVAMIKCITIASLLSAIGSAALAQNIAFMYQGCELDCDARVLLSTDLGATWHVRWSGLPTVECDSLVLESRSRAVAGRHL